MKNKYIFILAISLGLMFFSGHYAFASSCSNVLTSGAYTVSADCAFSGTVNGVEGGDLTIDSNVTLTINPGQTIVWNPGFAIRINGTISIGTNESGETGHLRRGYIWVKTTDSDGDGYYDSVAQYFGTDETTPPTDCTGSCYRRSDSTNGWAAHYTYVDNVPVDCNIDNINYFQRLTLAVDGDRDGYTASTQGSTKCVGNPDANGYYSADDGTTNLKAPSSTADCNDDSNYVYRNVSNLAKDGDRDSYTTSTSGSTVCVGAQDANGYYRDTSGAYTYKTPSSTADCNDGNSYVYRNVSNLVTLDKDADHDGYTTVTSGSTVCVGAQDANGRYRDANGNYTYIKASSTADWDDSHACIKVFSDDGLCGIENNDAGTCIPKNAGEQGLSACKRCNGTSTNAVKLTNWAEDTEGSYKCYTACHGCVNGVCQSMSGGTPPIQDEVGAHTCDGPCTGCVSGSCTSLNNTSAVDCSFGNTCCNGECADCTEVSNCGSQCVFAH